ncbi:uncharacterized protein FIBRA_06840 [Fibroporia radiculosa]|uniref:Carrier domain-containing protein n=1 Tax=Fibroporia radiculosa TaxID=599839 RepID=J4IBH2_9APHY|nr:uncharacterized protein FIBRA_06840 [Fibroporia radiculosa]CCM04656.1 predicted protein [Fibroporia radiculosa]
MNSSGNIPIAIVGIAAELPSGSWSKQNLDFKSFSKFLLESGEAYEKIPLERFNIEFIRGDGIGQVHTNTGAFLKDVNLFDYLEFGATAKDAHLMPVATRKLIESSFLSLLDSGIDYRGRNIGCYMSGTAHDIFSISGHLDAEAQGSFAYAPAMIANRVSYHLDLRGPSVPLDTACSSTVYATHLAIQAIRDGECEAAVVGGCQINNRFSEWLLYSRGGILSFDGKCKPFDASADGFGRGEGVVSMVLKPLSAALRDNDPIYGVILGTGVNSSGSLAPVNAPVASAQEDAMLRAFSQANRRPQDVDFIELHATGTAQGDPTEANWVGAKFKRDGEILAGSVKGNIGHTEITAFLASMCKVCSIFATGMIPPTVNLRSPNPAIKWKEYSLRVPVTPEPLSHHPASTAPLVAMTSSGIGGANGHCVVEGPPLRIYIPSTFWRCNDAAFTFTPPYLLISGGLSPRSATAVADMLTSQAPTLPNVLHSFSRMLSRRSRSMTWRAYAIAHNGVLSQFSKPSLIPKTPTPLIFVFSGQGPQHWNMGRELFKTCIPFRRTVIELDDVHRSVTGKSMIQDFSLFSEASVDDPFGSVWPIAVSLPALTILQIALFDALSELGIHPDAVIGHSAGETAVLYTSGAGSKALAVELAIARGKAMSLLEDSNGTMAALACSPYYAHEIISGAIRNQHCTKVEIGCYNAPEAVTLSGSALQIDLAVEYAKAKGIFATRLRTKIPVHSSMMELCRNEYQTLVGEVFTRSTVKQPSVNVFSTLSGEKFNACFDAQYFWENTRKPVKFTSAIQSALSEHPDATFIEIGPHPVLSSYISSISATGTAKVVCPLRRSKSAQALGEITEFLTFLGRLVSTSHIRVNFDALYGTTPSLEHSALSFPFSKREVSYKAPTFETQRQGQVRNGPLNYPQLQVNAKTHPGLADHVIKNQPIMPAAGYIEMALEFGARKLFDINFHSILSLSSERPTPVNVKLDGPFWNVSSASATEFTTVWPPTYNRLHASGHLSMTTNPEDGVHRLQLDLIRARLRQIDMKGFYEEFANFAQYGPTYRRIISWSRGRDPLGREEILVKLRGASEDLENISDYRFHPAILDAAIHILVHPAVTGVRNESNYYLPAKIGVFTMHRALDAIPFPRIVYTHATFVRWSLESLVYNVSVTDETGECICTIEELEVGLHGHSITRPKRGFQVVYRRADYGHTRSRTERVPSGLSEAGISRPFSSDNIISLESPTAIGNNAHPAHASLNVVYLSSTVIVVGFKRGEEISLQPLVSSMDPLATISLWFTATEGIDGEASLGFTRSLRREYPSWSVRHIIFSTKWTFEERVEEVRYLASVPQCEDETLVLADGSIVVPRIEQLPILRTNDEFDPDKPWRYEMSTLKHIRDPDVPDDHVLIRIIGITCRTGSAWAFVGRADDSQKLVTGITFDHPTNVVISHIGSIAEHTWSCTEGAASAPHVLAYVIAVLAIGQAAFLQPHRLRRSQIVVTHSDTDLGQRIAEIYEDIHLRVVAFPSYACTSEIQQAISRRPSVVVSATLDEPVQLKLHTLSDSTKIFLWNDPSSGIRKLLADDPWLIGDALRCAISACPRMTEAITPSTDLLPASCPAVVESDHSLFNRRKAYILVGGIGSLGLHIALWMYKNGAREIVLTSRSGLQSLAKKDEFISQRLLAYLSSLPDLTFRTEAVDALCASAMHSLVKSLGDRLGGCMILTTLYNDCTFLMQTAETFESSITSKVGVMEVVERVIDISALDFLIAMSSTVGLFGNAGQTNYACANTALSAVIRKYRNAIAFISPFITDTGFHVNISTSDPLQWARFKHLYPWGMTAAELCDYIGDSIRNLSKGSVWQYVPDFNWNLVRQCLGSSPLYDHLITENAPNPLEGEQEDQPSTLRGIVCKILDIAPNDLSADVPFTTYGLDSLSAASLSHSLRPIMTITQIQLLADMTLASLEFQFAQKRDIALTSLSDSHDTLTKEKVEEMLDMVERFATNLPSGIRQSQGQSSTPAVLITGTTGSLGAHMLSHLLQHSLYQIYALIRVDYTQGSAIQRQRNAFSTRGLNEDLLQMSNLVLVGCDFLATDLGLSEKLLSEMTQSVTHIVHLAWPINFDAQLSTFEPAIQGLRILIDFASGCKSQVKFTFASTAGIFRRTISANFPRTMPLTIIQGLPTSVSAAEVEIEDPAVAVGAGYCESKWVGERLLCIASERDLVQTTIVRVGQLTGGANGAWRTSEWIPSLVSTSVALGCLPDGSGSVSWLPVDTAARVMIEFMHSLERFFHLRHPRPVAWTDIMEHMRTFLRVPLVAYSDWFTRLDRGLPSAHNQDAIHYLKPGLRLLEFFRLPFDVGKPKPDIMSAITHDNLMENALKVSGILRDPNLPQLSGEDVEKWLNYWTTVGFLPREPTHT